VRFGILKDGTLVCVEQPETARALPVAANPALRSLFVVGDSTAASNWTNQLGWGSVLGE